MDIQEIIIGIFIVHYGLLAIALIIHLITRKVHLRREYLAVILIAPIAGLFVFLAIQYVHFRKLEEQQAIELEEVSLDDDIYWKALKRSDEESDILVPLEEALSLNDFDTRRRLLLGTMMDDPQKFTNILTIARANDDSETTHYATTSLAKIQSGFQSELQRQAVKHRETPEDLPALEDYVNTMERYINSGLLDDFLLTRQRTIYAKLIEEKLTLRPYEKRTLIRKIRNSLALKDHMSARDAAAKLQHVFPKDEETWIESIRINVESSDLIGLRETFERIKQTEVKWSPEGRQTLELWSDILENQVAQVTP